MRRVHPSLLLRAIRSKVGSLASLGTLSIHRRYQSFIGEQRVTARRSKAAYLHPLSPGDPAARNVTIPDSAHANPRSPQQLPAAVLQRRAQQALLLQLQNEVLWEGTVISDPGHKLIQHFLKLGSNAKYRNARSMLVVGGREMIRELCEAGHAPRHVLVREGVDIPDWMGRSAKMQLVRVTRRVFEECSPGNDGFVGDFELPPPPLKERLIANQKRMERVLVLDNVDDPGTFGTILRSAAGFHYDAIIATNHCADLYDHRVLRAARGAHFQTAVPIYSLSDEDGDDIYGILNHVMHRNKMLPVCLTSQDDMHVEGGEGMNCDLLAARCREFSTDRRSATCCVERESLSSFCLSRFTQHRDGPRCGYMLFAGPNHKQNMVKRLAQRVSRPMTQLLVDDMPRTDFLIALSVVMHALRPSGDWDYLPVSERSEPSTGQLQSRSMSVDIGPNRLSLSERDINLDEDEQRRLAHSKNEFMKWKRLQRRKASDYDHWMDAEEAKVKDRIAAERRRLVSPWRVHQTSRNNKAEGNMPGWVPNIIDEYRQSLDRDRLREEREDSEAFVRPSNYDNFQQTPRATMR